MMERKIKHSRKRLMLGLLVIALTGCGQSGTQTELTGTVPVTGKVTLNDKPLVGAQVLYVVQQGEPFECAGITDQEGMYQLQSARSSLPGAKPGSYKVVISCLEKADGTTVVANADTSPMQLMIQGAKEIVPAEYSDFLATKLRANVAPEGTMVDFKLTSN